MPAFQITAPQLPGAIFFSHGALLAHADERIAYDAAVADFANDGDDITLYEKLSALGYEPAEIAWHVARPGERDCVGFH